MINIDEIKAFLEVKFSLTHSITHSGFFKYQSKPYNHFNTDTLHIAQYLPDNSPIFAQL